MGNRTNTLRKTAGAAVFIPGSPGVPANPGQPYIPAHYTTVPQRVCSLKPVLPDGWHYVEYKGSKVPVPQGVSPESIYGGGFGGVGLQQLYTCETINWVVYVPAQPYIPPTPGIPARPSQLVVNNNPGWNAGGRSVKAFRDDGRALFSVDVGSVGVVAGLNDLDLGSGYADIDYAFMFAGGKASIVELASTMKDLGEFVSDDVWSIERRNGVVSYLRNGVTLYVSRKKSSGPLFLDTSLYFANDAIFNPKIEPIGSGGGGGVLLPFLALGGDFPQGGAGLGPGTPPYFGGPSCLPCLVGSGGNVLPKTAGGTAELLPLVGLASDRAYGIGDGYLHALVGEAGGNLGQPGYGVGSAMLGFMVGAAVGYAGGAGYQDEMDAQLLPFAGLGSEGVYGDSQISLMPIISWGSDFVGNKGTGYGQLAAFTGAGHGFAGGIGSQAVGLLHWLVGSATGVATPGATQKTLTWAVNFDTQASTLYANYPFNSFGKFDGHYFGAADDGVYLLDGESDNGKPVQASVLFGRQSFGSSALKRVAAAYLGVSSVGQMQLTVSANDSAPYSYQARRADDYQRQQRVDIGRGLRGTWFEFELCNSNGGDFELDSIEFAPVALNRRT